MRPYYQDDAVTIYHGDARDVLPRLDCHADLLLTDPPYGLNAQYGSIDGRLRTIAGDSDTSLLRWISAYTDVLAADSWAAVFCGWNGDAEVRASMAAAGLSVHTVIVWDKVQAGSGFGDLRDGPGIREQHEFIVLGRRGRPPRPWHGGNVWRVQRVSGSPDHPNAKPESLLRLAVDRLTEPGAVVLDPFLGSGTTLYAAKDLGRRAIGIEIEERYCEIAANRCRQEVLGLEL